MLYSLVVECSLSFHGVCNKLCIAVFKHSVSTYLALVIAKSEGLCIELILISPLLSARLMSFLLVRELMLLMLMRRTSYPDLQLVMMICGQKHSWKLQN